MTWAYDDGGRIAAGFKGVTGDCVTRAIAIAAELPYRTVYEQLFARGIDLRAVTRPTSRRAKALRDPSPRNGVVPAVYRPYLADLGWLWTPTMGIGTGTTVHLRPDELPAGRLIVRLSGHMSAVLDGVVHDLYDPGREGTRCIYGFWHR